MIPPFALVEQAVNDGLFPGAAVGMVTADGTLYQAAFGASQREPTIIPLHHHMYFDLASLTKVLFTVREILLLVEEGKVDLDSRIQQWLPEILTSNRDLLENVTVRQLLMHEAHLPASVPLYEWVGTPESRKTRFLNEVWQKGANVYSDVGYILLGLLIERIRGTPLQHRPLPPGLTFRPNPDCAVATEHCRLRRRVLRGEVHDENAYALGGAAGHAGLFGTVSGVMEVLQDVLNGRWLSAAAMDEMLRPGSATRALGWERKHHGWSGGSLAGASAIGHTGFTGTGCWVDIGRGVAWILLTNDVHPRRRHAAPIINLRRFFGNAVAVFHATGP
ncbi:serine hydrolase domain-containing protein [Deinococcus frigens]|uniref:serine hydrolase domain-containing protein n=1 Tax=Deinococcus frigens TaxID=249403 RepID=UPI000498248F|nr:serine hydrolase [Deinococcus frigens]